MVDVSKEMDDIYIKMGPALAFVQNQERIKSLKRVKESGNSPLPPFVVEHTIRETEKSFSRHAEELAKNPQAQDLLMRARKYIERENKLDEAPLGQLRWAIGDVLNQFEGYPMSAEISDIINEPLFRERGKYIKLDWNQLWQEINKNASSQNLEKTLLALSIILNRIIHYYSINGKLPEHLLWLLRQEK